MRNRSKENARERGRWKTDPEYRRKRLENHARWAGKNKKRIARLKRERYANDPIYKEKMKNYSRARYKAHRQDWLDYFRLKTYGLSRADFERLLKRQRGRCAICKTKNPGKRDWNVDHDHRTSRVRGLLCGRCNAGLGQFRDRPSLLRLAIKYLEAKS